MFCLKMPRTGSTTTSHCVYTGRRSHSMDRRSSSCYKPPVAIAGLRGVSSWGTHSKYSAQGSYSTSLKTLPTSGGVGRLRTPSNEHIPASPYLRTIKLQSRAREPLDLRSVLQSATHRIQPPVRSLVPLDRRPESAPAATPLNEEQASESCVLGEVSTSGSCSLRDDDDPLGSDQMGWEEDGVSEPLSR